MCLTWRIRDSKGFWPTWGCVGHGISSFKWILQHETHTHTYTPTSKQTSKQTHPHTFTHALAATLSHISWQVLTTICACGKRRVKADAAAAAAADVLEPYLCLRLVLAFYLFAPFVCAVCLPQKAHEIYALTFLPNCQLTRTHKLTHKHRATHTLAEIATTHSSAVACRLRIWLGSHFNCQSGWEINVCLEQLMRLDIQLVNWLTGQLVLPFSSA